MSPVTGFFIAVGIVSLACFGLMLRADRIRDRRRVYASSASSDGTSFSPGSDGFSLLNWFGGSPSSASSGDCCTSSSSFFSGGDGSCSSDGGSGGGDGGGGGD